METFVNPPREKWQSLVERVRTDEQSIAESVASIVGRVRRDGDIALRQLSLEIDKVSLEGGCEVSQQEVEEAYSLVPQELRQAVKRAGDNILRFHSAQMPREVDLFVSEGVRCVQRPVPLGRVGLYIPGGSAPLFSTVLMLAIPAAVAGCREVILCTPCGKDGRVAPAVLYAAKEYGVDRVFKIGGAQAIAAMAYGTESVPKVDRIFGPGNRYVTMAKELVSRDVAIDMPAGPSEVLVLCDDSAVPDFVASDLLSQAEHGKDSQAMLVCGDSSFALKVEACVNDQIATLDRSRIAEEALKHSRVVILKDEAEQIDFVNAYAPEHLIISTREPWEKALRVTAAGSVFIGNWSPESAGDYASGTNHTLPTSGWARSMSGVNVDSFLRKMTIQELSREGIASLGETIVTMARSEGLEAHARAALLRMGRSE